MSRERAPCEGPVMSIIPLIFLQLQRIVSFLTGGARPPTEGQEAIIMQYMGARWAVSPHEGTLFSISLVLACSLSSQHHCLSFVYRDPDANEGLMDRTLGMRVEFFVPTLLAKGAAMKSAFSFLDPGTLMSVTPA
ncbi:hypothetical protein cyc_07417 [Cyclospora cayetanensis]|uniref:Uncharacterized protein n=1 Tax=Cyclospora cayetanensis TaxID=88456 RepID=A0A1D3CTQ2_9EIME|nr:hypothetical protein cyc_07417 [Cyclospora cayetanensis]